MFVQSITNEWVLNKAGVKRELLDTVRARKLAYYGHTMRKQGSCLGKEIMQGTMPGARRRGRPRTAWMDNIKTLTGLSVEESTRMTEDRDKYRKYIHGVANTRSSTAKEQNRNFGRLYYLITDRNKATLQGDMCINCSLKLHSNRYSVSQKFCTPLRFLSFSPTAENFKCATTEQSIV